LPTLRLMFSGESIADLGFEFGDEFISCVTSRIRRLLLLDHYRQESFKHHTRGLVHKGLGFQVTVSFERMRLTHVPKNGVSRSRRLLKPPPHPHQY
jgi:hypothetical protein